MLEKQDRVLGGGEAWNVRQEVCVCGVSTRSCREGPWAGGR